MAAVVRRLIDRQRPPAGVPLAEGNGLEEILSRLASMILNAALNPQVLALHRLMVAESGRFPDLAAAVTQAGGRQEAVDLIAGLLQRHARTPEAAPVAAAQFQAQQFLQMVVSLPQLRALGMGQPMAAAEMEAWVRDTVALFLRGI
jgi:TetR/AcrR family transcriptional regulator, mexJK operon transcriptional repressor